MGLEDLVGQTLGHYRIIRPLGYGGTATVFLAEDLHLQRDVALKIFVPREGETQDFLRRFAREARVLARLDHPNILPIYDYGEQDEMAYLVIPYMAGGSLRDRLQKRGSLAPAEAIPLAGQALDALQYAHDHGLIHRDIKPGNMLFKANGALLLSDFGLVKVIEPMGLAPTNDTLPSMANEIAGTPDYMAPEQITGQVAPASDIYAMGVVVYEMLTGEHLFQSDNFLGTLMKHLYEQPRPLRSLNPHISPALDAAVMRALEKDPVRRYARASDFRQALWQASSAGQTGRKEDVQSQTGVSAGSPTIAEHLPLKTGYTTHAIEAVTTTTAQRDSALPPAKAEQPAQARPISLPGTAYQAGPSSPHDRTLREFPLHGADIARTRRGKRAPLVLALLAVLLVVLTATGGVLYSRNLLGPKPMATVPSRPTIIPGGGTATRGGPTSFPVRTQPVPPTTTDCPAAGTARPAIMAPLQLGNHQNVIYIVDAGTSDQPTSGTLKRRDITAGAKGIEIVKMANTYVQDAQVSQDGQWVLFTASASGQYQLRLVRVDGSGLQTLYCAPGTAYISSAQWSFNQRLVIFNVGPGKPTTYLLDMAIGALQAEISPQTTLSYIPRTWLDNTRIYLTGVLGRNDVPPANIYILDTRKGANQHEGDLQTALTVSLTCTDFDSSYDTAQLITSTCASRGMLPAPNAVGPSSLSVMPATGGPARTIYSNPVAGIVTVRGVAPNTLLFLVQNSSGDLSQNGIWLIKQDGNGATRLTGPDSNYFISLCPFTQYAWSNVSRDGSMYALEGYNPQTRAYSMYTGSLKGGPLNKFADISDGTQLYLAGWTSM